MADTSNSGQAHRIIKKKRKEDRRIAYFSMEIGIDSSIPTYSGGLGILAGDTIHSFADLNVPVVAVTLLYKKGYFSQSIDSSGLQIEKSTEWNPADHMTLLPEKAEIKIDGRNVKIQAWMYELQGANGYFVPVLFLDTDIEENNPQDRGLTHSLYGGDQKYRLIQEIILGIGGVRILKQLEYKNISRYHMNEGHASLLALELLRESNIDNSGWDIDAIKKMCLFTTHTPVPAGHDQFPYDLVTQLLGDFMPIDLIKKLGGDDKLNMTRLAMNLSDYVNGVAKQHGKVSTEMFPGYYIDSITNGVHLATWVAPSFKALYDRYIPGWPNDPFSLRYALSIPGDQIWNAHSEAKKQLIDYVNNNYNAGFDPDVLTIGFARRATTYKRADLVFSDVDRLCDICRRVGKIQFVFAGKAHPNDWPGKEIIKKIHSMISQLKDCVKIVYLNEYNISLAKVLIPGVDVWLNTPRRPQEASGTSGMKAALNGIPSFSILDGWWIEGCIEGITGWAIGSAADVGISDAQEAGFLYQKLESVIIPTFYNNRQHWIDIMRNAVAINASFFNTHRMVQQYVLRAYL